MIRSNDSPNQETTSVARAVIELHNMIKTYVSELFDDETAQEVARVLPKILAQPRNWQIRPEELSVQINDASKFLCERFGDGSYTFGLSVQGMLRKVAGEHRCDPYEIASKASKSELGQDA